MLKIRKSKVKLFGIITCVTSFCISYLGLTFYSIPEKASAAETTTETRSLSDITYMQDMSADICTNSKLGESKALKDSREGGYDNDGVTASYIVKRLSDGNCWMTQNLRLLGGTKITTEDSDLNAGSFVASGSNSDKDTITSGNSYTLPKSSISSFGTTSMAHSVYDDSEPKPYTYKYGSYYSWCAATAGCKTATGSKPDANQDAGSSICPKGWRLPTANKISATVTGYSYSYNKLVAGNNYLRAGDDFTWDNQANSNGYWLGTKTVGAKDASFFPATGYLSNGSLYGVGLYGNYWSSTADSLTTNARGLGFNSNNVNPSSSGHNYSGHSVRCVAPANTYADGSPILPVSAHTGLQVLVNPYLTIEATSGMSETMGAENILHGNISATIAANGEYNVMLSAEQPDLKDLDNTEFPGIPASSNVVANNNAWGIQNKDATYKAVTTTAQIFDSVDTFNETLKSTTHTYTVGVSVSPSIPAGKYSTTVTVTAVGN